MAEKKLFQVADEKGTPLKASQGTAKIEYAYTDDPETFVIVKDDPYTKGEVKTEEGKFPDAAAGKEIEKTKVTVTVSNNSFYSGRSKISKEQQQLIDSGKFKVKNGKALTKAELKTAIQNAIISKKRA
jgi:hypothetical protein